MIMANEQDAKSRVNDKKGFVQRLATGSDGRVSLSSQGDHIHTHKRIMKSVVERLRTPIELELTHYERFWNKAVLTS